MESFALKENNDYEKLNDELTFHDTAKLLAETIVDTLGERKPGKPLEKSEQVTEMLNPKSSTINIVQLSRPDNLTSYSHTESVQSYITGTDSSVVVWDLDLAAPTSKALLQQLGTTEQYPALLVFSGGKLQATVRQSLSAKGRESMIQGVKTNNSTLIAQAQLMKEYSGVGITVTSVSPSYERIKVVNSQSTPVQQTQNTPTTTIPTTTTNTNSVPNTINILQQPRLTLDPMVSVTGDTERFSAEFYSDAQTFLIITGSSGNKISLPLATKYKEIYTTGKTITDTVTLGTKVYECTLTNTGGMIKVALKLKNSTNTEKNLTAVKPLNVAHLKLRLGGKEIKTIDQRLYSMNGSMFPDSRESVYNEKKGIFAINGIDEGVLNFDKSLLYINPYGLESGKVYQGKELKFGLPVSYKLVVGANGVLQVHVEPALETLQKYADQGFKWPDLRPLTRKPNGGKGPTMPNIPEQLQDLLEWFEGDPNDSQEALPDVVDTSTESVEGLGLTFNGVKVNTVFANVYGVPHALLGSIKVKYNKSKKTFLLYRDNALIDSDLGSVGLSALEKGNSSLKTNFRFPKVTHEGTFRGEIDAGGNLRVYWGDKTWPGYESAESPLGWTLPFDHDPSFSVSSGRDDPRDVRVNGVRTGQKRPHRAVDIRMPTGKNIKSVGPGIVKIAGSVGGYGNVVYVDHGNGYETRYGHLSKINVKVGQQVDAGTLLGLSGNTGISSGPHLHFEVRKGGKYVRPEYYVDFTIYDKNHLLGGRKPAPKLKSYAEGEVSYGEASFYNDSFEGKKTQSEKTFRQSSNFAAHNSLPFGTIVKVTNTKTGLSTEVVIEDTGAFEKYNRAIDLSRSSMEKIGGIEEGTPYVKMQVIKLGDRKNPKSGMGGGGNSGGNNAPNTTPAPTPKPIPNIPPNTPPKTPESSSRTAEEYLKTKPNITKVGFARQGTSFSAYHPKLAKSVGELAGKAPRGWLVYVEKGQVFLMTNEGKKSLENKTITVGGKTYTVSVSKDSSDPAFPNAARFTLK